MAGTLGAIQKRGYIMIEKQELSKLTNYIEQNLRASKTGGLNFVDNRNYRTRLVNEQTT